MIARWTGVVQNRDNGIRKIVAGLLAIGMTVQIVMGMVWIACNFPSKWQFLETESYVRASASFVMDEYTGVLYPLLIRIAGMVMGIFGLPYEILIVLGQLLIALLCYCAFWKLCGVSGRLWSGKGIFMGLYLLTVPLCAQWHLTVLPQSLTCSLYMLLLGLCIRAIHSKEYRNRVLMYQVSGIWGAVTLLEPDYWYLAGIPVVCAAVLVSRHGSWKRLFQTVMLLVAVTLVFQGGNRLMQIPGSGGRIQKSLGAAMVSRLVWPNFGTNYYFWPEEIKAVMTQEQGVEISQYADNVQLVFGPMVERAYGREHADELYWQMAIRCLGDRTREIVTAVGKDFVAYLFAPWKVKDQLDGSGLSYSGWNYGKMRTAVPKWTRWYMDYGLVSFRFGIVAAVLYGLTFFTGSVTTSAGKKERKGIWLFSAICVLSQVLWYTLSAAGMMDYKNVLSVIQLWYAAIAVTWRHSFDMQS